MRRREFIFLLGSSMLARPVGARAQQSSGKIARVTYFAPARIDHVVKAFLQGLEDLGYIEGRNIQIEYRFAEGRVDKLDQLAIEAVQAAPDVIVAVGVAAAVSAKRATTSIPIVMAPVADPVQSGLVPSLVPAAGNVTGVSLYASELNQKRIELLKEAVPSTRRLAVLINTSNTGSSEYWRDMQKAAEQIGLEPHLFRTNGIAALDSVFAAIKQAGPEALAVSTDAQFDAVRERIVQLASEYRLPTIYEHRAFVEAGGLLCYGPNVDVMSYRAASYVDKILKGAKPANLPVEQPTKFELVINLKTAKTLGLSVPPSLLARADEVIE